MAQLSPAEIQNLVTKAFCLEALADKKGCTSRYKDLPERPLEGFILAGINSAPYLQKFAEARHKGSKRAFLYYPEALTASNQHKSKKYINFGLLEIMFPVVAARLQSDSPHTVISQINEVLKTGTRHDVVDMLKSRKIAWSTSKTPKKHSFEFSPEITRAKTPAEFYELVRELGQPLTSSRQWTEQYLEGWPILQEIFTRLNKSKESDLLNKITAAFNPVYEQNPDIRIGILADMCAAAIFLYLSFL